MEIMRSWIILELNITKIYSVSLHKLQYLLWIERVTKQKCTARYAGY